MTLPNDAEQIRGNVRLVLLLRSSVWYIQLARFRSVVQTKLHSVNKLWSRTAETVDVAC